MTNKEIFIKNLVYASGCHGLNESQLTKNLQSLQDVDKFIYTLSKCFNSKNIDWLSSTLLIQEKFEEKWSSWHNISEKYSESWGFKKKQTGCYLYAYFEADVPKEVNFLSSEVFYIGQSRSITRDAMIGRRNDFVSTVKNDPLVAHSCGKSFINIFGKKCFDRVYQAYLPLPSSMCIQKETDLLIQYYKKYNRLPVCNHKDDLVRVIKILEQREFSHNA